MRVHLEDDDDGDTDEEVDETGSEEEKGTTAGNNGRKMFRNICGTVCYFPDNRNAIFAAENRQQSGSGSVFKKIKF